MKKSLLFIASIILFSFVSKAQTMAMDFDRMDCNGVHHHLNADLDSGKFVLLHFFMPSCTSCPPPAKRIQYMANNILATHPGTITGYAFPFTNTSPCSYNTGWVSSNNLSLYAPMDSGATMVAYYGGFGMPTIVLLGPDHRVLFSTLSFATSDTTIMRDSIMAVMARNGGSTGIAASPEAFKSLQVFPNPSNEHFTLNLEVKENSHVRISLSDLNGKELLVAGDERMSGNINKVINTTALANGVYLLHVQLNEQQVERRIEVLH
jgi:Secretion system C-terminal sorting domain